MLPLNTLTDLTRELSLKQEEVQKLTFQISNLITHHENVRSPCQHKQMRKNIKGVAEDVIALKKDYAKFVHEIKEFEQTPLEVLKIMKSLPEMYENIIEATEMKYKRILNMKDEECQSLKTRIEMQDKQIQQLKDINLHLQQRETQDKGEQSKRKSSINQGQKAEKTQQKGQEDLISSMEVTIREYYDLQQAQNCRRITQLAEEEEEGEKLEMKESETLVPQLIRKGQNLFTFQNILESLQLDKKARSSRQTNNQNKVSKPLMETIILNNMGNYEKFQPKILKNKSSLNNKSSARAKSANMSKNVSKHPSICSQSFWKELKNQINGPSKDTIIEEKQNNKNENIRGIKQREKKDVISKLHEFRKNMCLDQGIKRFGFGLH